MVTCPKEKDKLKNKGGRPTKKTPELVQKICDLMSYEGLSLKKASMKFGITDATFIGWVLNDDYVYKLYHKAMEVRNHRMAHEILDIADDVTEDEIFDENGNRKCNNEWINRSRLRIETRKFLLSKLLPKVYGDKLEIDSKSEVTHQGNVTIEILPVTVNKD